MEELKMKFINLATSLALQESNDTGRDYTECINKACNEACIRLGVSSTVFIKMFLQEERKCQQVNL